MRTPSFRILLVLTGLAAVILAGCAAAPTPTSPPAAQATATSAAALPTAAPQPVEATPTPPPASAVATSTSIMITAPTATAAMVEKATHTPATGPIPTSGPTSPVQTPLPSQTANPLPENRQVELEFPSSMTLGESDVVRLTLSPSKAGYVVQAEFPDHQVSQQELPIQRPPAYTLYAVARLDGVAFDLSPQGDQVHSLPPGEPITWRWSLTPQRAGRQRLALTLLLRWQPDSPVAGPVKESVVFSRGLEVQVESILGLPPATAAGLGICLGSGLL
jgi:hypothetical protein